MPTIWSPFVFERRTRADGRVAEGDVDAADELVDRYHTVVAAVADASRPASAIGVLPVGGPPLQRPRAAARVMSMRFAAAL
jgi:hypothetical protein